MPDLLKTYKGPRTSARALLSSPLRGTAHLLVPYTENTKRWRTFYGEEGETEAESVYMIYEESQLFC